MFSLIRLAYQILFFGGLFLAVFGTILCFGLPVRGKRDGFQLILISGLFCLVDAVWLKALHWLNLSYGPVQMPWLALAGVRLAISFLLLVSWHISSRKNGGWHQIKGALCKKAHFGLQVVLLIFGLYAFYIEPFWIDVNQIELETDKFKEGTQLRIVQLSDFHIERITPRERGIITRVQAAQPDVIVVTGDYPNLSYIKDETTWEQIQWVVSQLHARYGVYLIDGSVESAARVEKLAEATGAIAMENRSITLEWEGGRLGLLGIQDEAFHQAPAAELLAHADDLPEDAYRVFLFHTPDLIQAAAQMGMDLYLCGHTHGGQIRLPFYGAIYTSSMFHKQYEMGQYQVGATTLYVNRGIGMEGLDAPRARFLARPEIAIIDITGTGP